MILALVPPVFLAGVLMFLAPCTLPLIPSFLVFIGGTSAHREGSSSVTEKQLRRKLFVNALFYVLGFSVVFIGLGVGLGILAQYGLGNVRFYLERISGALIILLGLFMLGVFRLPVFATLNTDHRFRFPARFAPGKPLSAFLFGATFAFGWSPCIGPILGSVLLLSSTSGTVLQGAMLLAVFSLGLGIPFLLMALGVGQVTRLVRGLQRYLGVISFIGGLFITLIGVLLLTGNMGLWNRLFLPLFSWISQERLLDYF